VAAERRILTSIVLVAATSFLAACGSSSSKSSTPAAQPSVSIALTPAPATTNVPVGSTTGIQLTPVVSNDPSKTGVDWAVTCSSIDPAGAPSCGFLSICPPNAPAGTCTMHSASGTAVSYIPPAVPYGDAFTDQSGTFTNDQIVASQTVNITTFATADHTKNVTTQVTVDSYVNVLSGTYVFQVKGSDINSIPYQITGVLAFDGKGNITSGQETLNSVTTGNITPGFSMTYTVQSSDGLPSSYFIGPDGRGTITLNLQPTSNSAVNPPIQETFSLVVLSSSQALIAEDDTLLTLVFSSEFSAAGAGTLELQDPTAAATLPSGPYAFVTSGSDAGSSTPDSNFGSAVPTAIGGILNIDNNPSPGAISGNGSLADQDYYDVTKNTPPHALLSCAPPAGVTGTVSQPSSLGIVTITLNTCLVPPPAPPLTFAGYIVDANHIRLIETDDINGANGTFLTAGIAISQNNPSTGTYAGPFNDASLSGLYVYGVLGYDINEFAPSSFTAAGIFCPDGGGLLNCPGTSPAIGGITDTFFPGEISLGVTGAFYATQLVPGTMGPNGSMYAVDTYPTSNGGVGIGRAAVTPKFPLPTPRPRPTVLFYFTGDGKPLILWSQGEDVQFPAIGTGIAYPQTTGSTLSFGNPETYGVSYTQPLALLPSGFNSENDGTGQMKSTLNGTTVNWTGVADDLYGSDLTNYIGSGPVSFSDTFTPSASVLPGILNGTFMYTASGPASGGPTGFVDYYLIDNNHGFFIETDLMNSPPGSPNSGSTQVELGYFAQACDVTAALTSPTGCQTAARSSRRAALKRRNSHRLNKNSFGTNVKKQY